MRIELQVGTVDVLQERGSGVQSRARQDAQKKDEFTDLTAEPLVRTEPDGHHQGLLVLVMPFLKPEGNFVANVYRGNNKRFVGHSQVSDNTRLIRGTASLRTCTTRQFVADPGNAVLNVRG